MLKDKIADLVEQRLDHIGAEEITKDILTAFKEALPKEKSFKTQDDYKYGQYVWESFLGGYNICLSDILKTIGGVE